MWVQKRSGSYFNKQPVSQRDANVSTQNCSPGAPPERLGVCGCDCGIFAVTTKGMLLLEAWFFFSFYLNDPAGQSCHLVLNAGFLALSAFFLSLALTANTRLPGSLRHGDSEWRDVNVTYTAAACLTHSRCKHVSRMVKKYYSK